MIRVMRGNPLPLILWTRADCAACVEAAELMASLSAALGFEWETREAASDFVYRDALPVVTTAEGFLLAEAPLAAAALARAVRALSAPD